MMSSRSFLFSFFLVLVIANSSLPGEGRSPLCHNQERLALVQFAHSFIVDCSQSRKPPFQLLDKMTWTIQPAFDSIPTYPKVVSWGSSDDENVSSDCCGWDGVECDKDTGRVVGLDLSSSCLFGKFPTNSSVFRLVHLQRLSLANNHFNFSPIPEGFGQLSRLTYLNLSYAVFSGQIPPNISELSKLSSLDLSYNVDPFDDEKPLLQLSSNSYSLESLVHNMTTLETLNLDMVNLSSGVPLTLGNLTSLRSISLSSCGLHGKFPSSIFYLPNLETLVVSQNNNLKGTLPDFLTSTLRSLDVSWTSFSGSIPPSIGNLGSLDTIDLEGCNFIGALPASLGNLTNLKILQLDENMFTGEIPPSFANLTQLIAFDPSSNNINVGPQVFSWLPKLRGLINVSFGLTNIHGTIPSSMANLTELRVLSLRYNHLSGTIPSWLANLTHLRALDLEGNPLMQGPLPHELSNLADLQVLAVGSNYLFVDFEIIFRMKNLQVMVFSHASIKFPSNVNASATKPKFQILKLNSCNLTEFPQFLKDQDKLEALHLLDNKITGRIPLWLLNNNIDTLRVLAVSHNAITGFERPQVWFQRSGLTAVFLDNNLLEGSLIFPSATIKVYIASTNKLQGDLPRPICNMTSLRYLDISNNNITGELPQCMGDLGGSLVALNLQGNQFHGVIPATYTKSCKLKLINLSENQFRGRLPRSLASCKQLEVLDVGRNHIHDTFPLWLGSLPMLHILVLRCNRFHGPVKSPAFDVEFTKLRIMDLSHNFHVGLLPFDYIQKWNTMKGIDGPGPSETVIAISDLNDWKGLAKSSPRFYYNYSITITNKGNEMVYTKVLNVFKAIDLSSNKFQGPIPEFIGDLVALEGLNLSYNNIDGSIPSSLGNIKDLESLDLSWNNLSGEIPQELKGVTSLEVFDVSYNQLTGPIPQGNQFNTFESSAFEGNPGLCGNPLRKSCENHVDESAPLPPTLSSEGDEELSYFDTVEWIIISLGWGSGFIVGFVAGKFFTDWKHHWFLKTFGNA